ncbi:vacuolar cation-transporting ATPase Ypk9p [[Candida] jaroonii]|uniref:Vacuolar cation-transporting ATPase Ypk9p n=1 Tax=[Candida] jaroonii TaxID=467808 RepID=A0ACA9YB65_9ASCO|nr:vacuolar cation-transporting ATPase Ypk9p [[Candida] jaroonii]
MSRERSLSRSRSITRTRSSTSSVSLSRYRRQSVDSNISVENNEIFSGAGSEILPSSITSFHYPHSLGRRQSTHRHSTSQGPVSSVVNNGYGTHSLTGQPTEGYSRENSPLLDGESVKSHSSVGSNEETHFRFFNLEEIQQAPGGSTYGDRDVDYDTDWEYPKYTNEINDEAVEWEEEREDERELEEQINNYETERRRRDSESSLSSPIVEDYVVDDNFDCVTHNQRYYLAEEDLVIGIAGYRDNLLKKMGYYLICIFTLGIGYLILRWMPRYRINLIGTPCPLGIADWCVIENEYGELTIAPVSKTRYNERLSNFFNLTENEEKDPVVPTLCSFKYRYLKFFYHPLEDIFKTNGTWYDSLWLHTAKMQGLSQNTYEERQVIFETNAIEIEEKSIGSLLVEEVLHPFYIFQIFSIGLWLMDDYYYYASCIFIISLVSIVNTLIETKSTMKKLSSVSKFSCEIRVWRNEFWKTISSDDLVPGDIFEIDPSLNAMPCDALLINGETIVNESMLTGESVPISKVAVSDDQLFNIKDNLHVGLSRSFLYNGTRIMKQKSTNDEPVKALVVKTGFSTTKGSLIRSMLFPKPIGFKFYEDSFRYIGFMTGIAFLGFLYSTYNFIKLGLPKSIMILRGLDIITIVVPPALPATLTIGTTFAINRLKKSQIFCISPTRVNIGGKLDVICFDKTGTLTEDGLDVLGVHVVNNAPGRKVMRFEDLSRSISDIKIGGFKDHETNNGPKLIQLMSTCHSLRLIDEEILGDPLDLKMFQFTDSQLIEGVNPLIVNNIGKCKILKEFEFDSNLRRMSVLVTDKQHKYIFCKGAPEVMLDICEPESIPPDFHELLYHYTNNGYRVIACASKEIPTFDSSREEYESQLEFNGFIIFENKLKSQTTPTIHKLKSANIRTVMCTGDNILTAISVGKECGIVDSEETIYIPRFNDNESIEELVWEDITNPNNVLDSRTLLPLDFKVTKFKLAITGEFFKIMLTKFKDFQFFEKFLINCDIFARMSPDEKHELVNQLQKLDYTVGFIGDGANDCGALKAANVGVSLSEAEASIAAPFTSRIFEISCLLDVIKEGRSSLVTSFSSFKFMSLYSAIQFITVTILYKRGINLGDFQFLYIDLVLILPLAIFMSWSKPSDFIIKKRPTANLVSVKILGNLIGDIVILLINQVIIWKLIQTESWYVPPVPGNDEEVQSFDNTILFLFSNFQYIMISILLNEGKPYREPMIKNKWYLVTLTVLIIISMILFATDEDSFIGKIFELRNLPTKYYFTMVILSVVNYMALYICNEFIFAKLYKLRRRRASKKHYKNLIRQFDNTV